MPRFLRKFRRQKPISTELAPLERLPVEIVEKILIYLQLECNVTVSQQGYTDNELTTRGKNLYLRSLVSLAKCSKTLQNDLLAPIVYRQVVLTCKTQVERFNRALSKGHIRTEIVAAIETVIFEEVANDTPQQVTIASYSYSTDNHQKTYAELMVAIVKKLPNLESVRLYNMAPKFQFKSSKPSPHVKSLTVSTEPGWRVYIQPDMLEQFPNIHSLILQDIVIDGNSLSRKPTRASVAPVSPGLGSPLTPTKSQTRSSSYFSFRPSSPKHMEVDSEQEPNPLTTLHLTECTIHPTAIPGMASFFDNIQTLVLTVKTKNQTKSLATGTLLPTLTNLTIELETKGDGKQQPPSQTDILPFLEKYTVAKVPKLEKLTLTGITHSLLLHPQFLHGIESMPISILECHLQQKPPQNLDINLPLTPSLYYKHRLF